MKEQHKEYPWIKVWVNPWLQGSGRMMHPEKRGVWIDLLVLAQSTKFKDGRLAFEVGKPMSRDWIAGTLCINRGTLDACIAAFKADVNFDDGKPRIQEWEDGTLFITNFQKYQAKPDRIKRSEEARQRAKETKYRNKIASEKLLEAVNRLCDRLGANRYIVQEDGNVMDTKTGEVLQPDEAHNLLATLQKSEMAKTDKAIEAIKTKARKQADEPTH